MTDRWARLANAMGRVSRISDSPTKNRAAVLAAIPTRSSKSWNSNMFSKSSSTEVAAHHHPLLTLALSSSRPILSFPPASVSDFDTGSQQLRSLQKHWPSRDRRPPHLCSPARCTHGPALCWRSHRGADWLPGFMDSDGSSDGRAHFDERERSVESLRGTSKPLVNTL